MNNEEKNMISRREAIKKTALAFGAVLSTPAALTFLQGCSSPSISQSSFTDEQRAIIEIIADIIIPATDTPGATEAGAVELAEQILFNIVDKEGQQEFLNNLADFQSNAEKELGSSFQDAGSEDQTTYITNIHDEVFGGDVDWGAPRPFIWQVKEAIVNAYFATEVGMIQVQNYIQIPGRYDGCISFEENGGRVWA